MEVLTCVFDGMNEAGQADAHLGVYVLDTGTGRTVSFQTGRRFAFCSTYKALATGILLMRGAPPGRALEYSDNTAANLLLVQLGGPHQLQRDLRGIGDQTTNSDRDEPSVNTAVPGDPRDTSTARALGTDLERFVLGHLLTPGRRALLTGWLRRNTTGGPYIRAGVPAGWTVGDKTGNGDWGPLRRPAGGSWSGRTVVEVAGHPGQQPGRVLQVRRTGRGRLHRQAIGHVERGVERFGQLGAGQGGVPHRARVEGPHHFEPAVAIISLTLTRQLPAGQADRIVASLADQHPFAEQDRPGRHRDLARLTLAPGGRREIGEHHHRLGRPGQLVPAGFGLTEIPLPLEAGEEDRVLGPGAVFVLDRPGQGEQRAFAQDLGLQSGMPAAQGREHGRVGGRAVRGGLRDGRGQAQPGGALPQYLLDQNQVTRGVPAVPGGHPLRPGEAETGLPAAQRGRGHPGALGQLTDGHAVLRFPHDPGLHFCKISNSF